MIAFGWAFAPNENTHLGTLSGRLKEEGVWGAVAPHQLIEILTHEGDHYLVGSLDISAPQPNEEVQEIVQDAEILGVDKGRDERFTVSTARGPKLQTNCVHVFIHTYTHIYIYIYV